MLFTYHIFRVGQHAETGSVEWPQQPEYHHIKELAMPLLGGAYPERVAVLFNGKPADMFVDEIGMLKGLPRNREATAIYRANRLTKHPDTDPETLPAIYGTAIVFDQRVWF
ncbi:MAG: hypothetical protein AB7F35_01065 [Acetobacteraceae bacterium]